MPVIDLGSVVGPQGPQGATGATGAQGIQGNPGPNQVTDQTSTNLNGVLFGSQSRVTVKPVDATPTADSANLVSSGGTDKAIKGRVPVYGLGKNLLDNWYFVGGGSQLGDGVFPINQRGHTQYDGTAYGIDRWKGANTYGNVKVTSTGLKLTSVANAFFAIDQITQNANQFEGKSVTISCLLASGLFVQGTAVVPSSDSTFIQIVSGILVIGLSKSSGVLASRIRVQNYSTIDVVAVKLELGTEQTLCHNEGTAENPVWVLNEIPDYGEELRKCQRYYVSLKPRAGGTPLIGVGMVVSATQAAVTIPLPVTLNGASVTPAKSGTIKLWHGNTIGSSAVDISGFASSAVSDNSVTVTVSVSGGLNIGEVCALQFRSEDAGLSFSCEL